jgi:hypothetical protein
LTHTNENKSRAKFGAGMTKNSNDGKSICVFACHFMFLFAIFAVELRAKRIPETLPMQKVRIKNHTVLLS